MADSAGAVSAPASQRFLFGTIAVEHGMVAEGDLMKAIAVQSSAKKPVPLGEILLEMGRINRAQLQFLRAKQAERLAKTDPVTRRPAGDHLFGKLVVRLGFCREDHIHEAFREMARREAEGAPRRVGEVLVELGFLSPYQVKVILGQQNKRLLRCPACVKHYNILGFQKGYRLRCYYCNVALRPPRDPLQVKADEEFFFDHDRAEHVELLGQIGVKKGYYSKEQLRAALEHQETNDPDKSLGDVLVSLGLVDAAKIEEMIALQKKIRDTRARPRGEDEAPLGELAVKRGLVARSVVDDCLKIQKEAPADGGPKRLGRILVDKGFLAPAQVIDLLAAKGIAIGLCSKCNARFNVSGARPIEESKCRACEAPLRAATEREAIDVAGDLFEQAEAGSLDEIELEKDHAKGAWVSTTKQIFRQFYKTQGIERLDGTALAESPEDETVSKDKHQTGLIPLDDLRRQLGLKKTTKKVVRAKASGRSRWLAPVAVGVPLVLVSTIGIVFWVSGGSPENRQPGSVATDLAGGSTQLPVDPELVDGMRVVLHGVLVERFEKPVVLREPDFQAFLVSLGKGDPVCAVDLAGTSFDRLESIEGGRSVLIRGSFAKKSPAKEPFPGWSIQGYLTLEFWTPVPSEQLPPEGARVTVLSRTGS